MHKEPVTFKQKLSLAYLWLVPPVTMAIGFGIGSVSYKAYFPVWVYLREPAIYHFSALNC